MGHFLYVMTAKRIVDEIARAADDSGSRSLTASFTCGSVEHFKESMTRMICVLFVKWLRNLIILFEIKR